MSSSDEGEYSVVSDSDERQVQVGFSGRSVPNVLDDNYAERYRAVERERRRILRRTETEEQRNLRNANERRRRRERQESLSIEERDAIFRQAQERRRRALNGKLQYFAFAYDPATAYDEIDLINIGKMNVLCKFCRAFRFRGEPDGICCGNGSVRLDSIEAPPEPIFTQLFNGTSSESRDFLSNIRRYNDSFQMTSLGVKSFPGVDGIVRDGWMPTFRVQGKIYHQIGSLFPSPNDPPQYLQVYFTGDSQAQVDLRTNRFKGTKLNLVRVWQKLFEDENRLIRSFKTALEHMPSDEHTLAIRADKTPAGEHQRNFNAPTDNGVAIIVVDGEYSRRDIVIQRRNNNLEFVDEMHPSYDALQYPILFFRGNDTYHWNLKKVRPETGALANEKLTTRDYYRYHLHVRDNNSNFLLQCRSLANQFIVDCYAKIESERLRFIRFNQATLRADDYVHLQDALENDGNAENIGQRVILPASFIGSPRHMHEYSQDAMSYCQLYGRPDLFITFTCNPSWKEITELLSLGQSAPDRHDVTARVFNQKLHKLIDVLTTHEAFGPSRCYMYSVEWQKRGLPHAHILLWLINRIRPDKIDDIISAELPDRESDPILFDIVVKNMIHGPCGALNYNSPCMDTEKRHCTKNYPRAFLSDTITGNDGYPLYRRRKPGQGGFSAFIESRGLQIDNSWVVPYSPLLLKMFNAHINVEFCNSVKSIKYVCKYINKGSDRAIIQHTSTTGNNDEVESYQLGRYLDTSESIWRLFGFHIHDRDPAVQKLAVHLENGQRVFFNPANAAAIAANPPNTTLTSFFSLCQSDSFAKTLLYSEVPAYYTFTKSKGFSRRKKCSKQCTIDPANGMMKSNMIGRMYTVHPKNDECFFLRILLTKIRGPTSFANLRTYGTRVCSTYREACLLHGYLESDTHWVNALDEAAATKMTPQLRSLFAIIISTCNPSNPLDLWQRFREHLSEDILHECRENAPNPSELSYNEDIFNVALIRIEDICLSLPDGRLVSQLGLPAPHRDVADPTNAEVIRETNFNVADLNEFVSDNEPRLTQDQSIAFNALVDAIDKNEGKLFFLDAPGGTGKTFVLNLLLAKIRAREEIILALASSGIAATLLAGGRTAHSGLNLPLDVNKDVMVSCSISRGSAKAHMLRRCRAIIWDECTMSHKKSLEAVDRMLKDIRQSDDLFGGVVVILSGDFRQTLPVIQRGTPQDEMDACLKNSLLWHHVIQPHLTTNMRVHLHNDSGAEQFARALLTIGDGLYPTNGINNIIYPTSDICQIVSTRDELIDRIFPNLSTNLENLTPEENRDWLCERAILAAKNDMVDELNFVVQSRLVDRLEKSYLSIDKTVEDNQAVHYPVEFLNSLSIPGTPPHKLTLKVGSPIIMMRNLRPPRLCNGTRLVVKEMLNNVIVATIITGPYKGNDEFIPRIRIEPNGLLFRFQRLQFPVKLAYAMTINKSQGQSLKTVGVDLTHAPFSHGQLYVAFSRVSCPSNLFALAPDGATKNVVYREILQR